MGGTFDSALWPALRACVLLLLAVCTSPANAELVIIANPDNPATFTDPSQVRQIYFGASHRFIPIERDEQSSLRGEFYRKVLEEESSRVKAMWAKLVFTGRGKAPKVYHSSAEVKKAVSANINAIGYVERSEVDRTVKIIAVIP